MSTGFPAIWLRSRAGRTFGGGAAQAVAHDGRGNLVTRGALALVYDEANRLGQLPAALRDTRAGTP